MKRAELVPPEKKPRPEFKLSRDARALTEYFKTQKPGAELTWSQIETDTGIPMSLEHKAGPRGRSLARTAIKRAGHTQGYQSQHGVGLILGSGDTALEQNRRRQKKVRNEARRAHREVQAALEKFNLENRTKAELDYRAAIWGSILGSIRPQAIESRSKMPERPMLPKR